MSDLERAMAVFVEQTNLAIAEIRSSTAEIRASNRRTDERLLELQRRADEDRKRADERWKQADERWRQANERWMSANAEWKEERRDFNKRLAELSDSMGTLIEDMVAPCGFQLAKAVFATEEAHTCGIRIEQKHPTRRGEMMELDLLAIGSASSTLAKIFWGGRALAMSMTVRTGGWSWVRRHLPP